MECVYGWIPKYAEPILFKLVEIQMKMTMKAIESMKKITRERKCL